MSMYPQPMGGYQMAPTPSFGATPDLMQGLGQFLGQIGSRAAGTALQDPNVQATINDIKDQCQIRAKAGVTEWFLEWWPALAFGAFAILVGNYIVLSIALIQSGVRRKHFKTPKP